MDEALEALKESDGHVWVARYALIPVGLWDMDDNRRLINKALSAMRRANELLSHGLSTIGQLDS